VSLEAAFEAAWRRGGPAGALALLESIFTVPDHQQARDGLPPAALFALLRRLFAPDPAEVRRRMAAGLEALLAERDDSADLQHRLTPLNALVLTLDTYEHGRATLHSAHVDGAGAWRSQYELRFDLIEDADGYRGRSAAEAAQGETFYGPLCALESGDYESLRCAGAPAEGETLRRMLLASLYREASAALPPPTPEQRYQLLAGAAAGSPERDALVALLRAHPALLARARAEAAVAAAEVSRWLLGELGGRRPPADLAARCALLQAADPGGPAAEALTLAALALPAPPASDRALDDRVRRAVAFVSAAWGAWEAAPAERRPGLLGALLATRDRALAAGSPALTVAVLERERLREAGETPPGPTGGRRKEGAPSPWPLAAPEWLEALGRCLDAMPARWTGFDDGWDFVMPRIQAAGPQAAPLLPRLRALLERYGTPLGPATQLIPRLAEVLFELGEPAPPAPVLAYCARYGENNVPCLREWRARAAAASDQ
jgi:hypothetical protein